MRLVESSLLGQTFYSASSDNVEPLERWTAVANAVQSAIDAIEERI
jgi:hypothetical protein